MTGLIPMASGRGLRTSWVWFHCAPCAWRAQNNFHGDRSIQGRFGALFAWERLA